MYILVEIIHTEFQYISLIEMQKYNWNRKRIEKKETGKKGTFTNRDKRVRQPCRRWQHLLSRLVLPTGTKVTGVPGWETGTTGVSQPGQINVFVVVYDVAAGILLFASRYFDTFQYILFDVANNNFLCCKRVFLMLQRTVQWKISIGHPSASNSVL